MKLLDRIRRLTRPETDAECIERVRKQARHMEKYGKWLAVLQLIGGVAFLVMGFVMISLVKKMAGFGVAQNPAAPQPPNLMWPGFVVGILFGFITAGMFAVGARHLILGVIYLRGNRRDRLLLRYHDAIATMVQNETSPAATSIASNQPQGPPATNDSPEPRSGEIE